MKEIAQEIRKIVNQESDRLFKLNPDEVSRKSAPQVWSLKEVLGHLIDSAANNHQRIVRAGYQAAADFPPYSQNDWVRIQRYNESDWKLLINLWTYYNLHLSNVIEDLPPDLLSSPCFIGIQNLVTLEFVVRDYLRHLSHHLTKMINQQM